VIRNRQIRSLSASSGSIQRRILWYSLVLQDKLSNGSRDSIGASTHKMFVCRGRWCVSANLFTFIQPWRKACRSDRVTLKIEF
jgi:hypothetical protein